MTTKLILCIISFLYGIVIGSFLNVCIFRIPNHEGVVKTNSHCMSCGHKLAWYDLIPILSYIILGGRCRSCKTKISVQYPLIEGLNGILYVIIFAVNGCGIVSILYCLLASALIVLSGIDFKTYEIPFGINVFIFILGLARLALDYRNWSLYVIGFFAVSTCLLLLYYVTKGRAIGGGDVKLMAACGLLIGWKLIILAFFLGCILGSVIHLIRMKVSKEGHMLAMGPYLSMGVFISMLWGDKMIQWYLGIM